MNGEHYSSVLTKSAAADPVYASLSLSLSLSLSHTLRPMYHHSVCVCYLWPHTRGAHTLSKQMREGWWRVTLSERLTEEAWYRVCGLSCVWSVCLCISVHASLPVCLSVSLSVRLSVYLFLSQSVCLSVYLSVCLSVCLSICFSVCLSVYLSVCVCMSASQSVTRICCVPASGLSAGRRACVSHTHTYTNTHKHSTQTVRPHLTGDLDSKSNEVTALPAYTH